MIGLELTKEPVSVLGSILRVGKFFKDMILLPIKKKLISTFSEKRADIPWLEVMNQGVQIDFTSFGVPLGRPLVSATFAHFSKEYR